MLVRQLPVPLRPGAVLLPPRVGVRAALLSMLGLPLHGTQVRELRCPEVRAPMVLLVHGLLAVSAPLPPRRVRHRAGHVPARTEPSDLQAVRKRLGAEAQL
eukprot:Amastigsp_a189143_7.p3 type:complete len:101 gc:universal Amastigsp_a189143_7:598-900(+)